MSIDYGEKEREFLESLAGDTGRDLAGWMAAISATGLKGRNEIIDWLRHQGFMFSKASWLERIFNNGGKPIYADRGAGKPAQRSRAPARSHAPEPSVVPTKEPERDPIAPSAAPAPPPAPSEAKRPQAPVQPPTNVPLTSVPPPAPEANLETTLAKAKAFRPLAAFLLAEIQKALPGSAPEPYANHVAIVLDGREVAIVAISPKDIRLLIAGLGMPFEGGLTPAKLPQGLIGARLTPTHMVTLTDARAVTPELLDRIRLAALKTVGKS